MNVSHYDIIVSDPRNALYDVYIASHIPTLRIEIMIFWYDHPDLLWHHLSYIVLYNLASYSVVTSLNQTLSMLWCHYVVIHSLSNAVTSLKSNLWIHCKMLKSTFSIRYDAVTSLISSFCIYCMMMWHYLPWPFLPNEVCRGSSFIYRKHIMHCEISSAYQCPSEISGVL